MMAASGDYETILYQLEDGVARITLNRPERMNAMNRAMRLELAAAFRRAGGEARAMLIDAAQPAGDKRAFCAGQDLEDVRGDALDRTILEEYGPMLQGLVEAPIPSVAAVAGAAAGAGLHLALAADIVIAARSARFVAPFARLGLMAAGGGSWLVPRAIGDARARGFLLLGEPVDGETAADWGMAWRAVADDALAGEAESTARKLAAGPTQAFRLTKEALRASGTATLAEHLPTEARLQAEAGRTEDYQEGVEAFLGKRRPVFRGR